MADRMSTGPGEYIDNKASNNSFTHADLFGESEACKITIQNQVDNYCKHIRKEPKVNDV